ncbi:Hypothetical predicted protein [Mytilus galloprovincialis]|uniref:Uncharacterized protein n=1 Tax=Mytilus galloprovincialis TaxID=29158 RepID=A0A8B6GB13_MYTGA|nr:Hypothetical predicted protein [Mytilus galloprovincialis]
MAAMAYYEGIKKKGVEVYIQPYQDKSGATVQYTAKIKKPKNPQYTVNIYTTQSKLLIKERISATTSYVQNVQDLAEQKELFARQAIIGYITVVKSYPPFEIEQVEGSDDTDTDYTCKLCDTPLKQVRGKESIEESLAETLLMEEVEIRKEQLQIDWSGTSTTMPKV